MGRHENRTPAPRVPRQASGARKPLPIRLEAVRTSEEGLDEVGGVAVVGVEEQVVAQLRRLADIGVTEFVGFLAGDPDTMRRTSALLAGLHSEPAPLQ